MSEHYMFHDPDGIYFTATSVVFWIDLFTRNEMKHVVIDSLQFCQMEKGLVIHGRCLMPSHLHMLISTAGKSLPDIIRDFIRHTSRQIVNTIEAIHESRKDWLLTAFKKVGKGIKRVKNTRCGRMVITRNY